MLKQELRKKIKQKRNELALRGELDVISKKIVQNIASSEIFNSSKEIALYYPLKNEVNLLDLLKFEEKNFYFPKCKNNVLCFAKYNSDFKMGAYSIPEPTGCEVNPHIFDVIYIPALCCNSKCYRLGYGMGFYDRFFSSVNIPAKKIIVCPSCLVTEEFEQDETDYKCDSIICENMV